MRAPHLVGLSLLALACHEPMAGVTTAPPPAVGDVVYLELSSADPAVGTTLIATARVHIAGTPHSIASFVARVHYDAAALAFQSASVPGGAMSAVNGGVSGVVAVAAASANGLADSTLFSVRFLVQQPIGTSGVSLQVGELTDTDFGSRRIAVASPVRIAPAAPQAGAP